ncbi:Ff.00g114050.m01.CDS01 [Fusarium sp. VM40]|nr:Ff.00g114050.m01.CDS01 [Fusarium sp. VM40]
MAASLDNNSDDGREKGWTRLACAANAGDVGRVLELLAGADRSGIDIDARDYSGCTSLTLATQKGHTAVVETLLAYGANPNLQDIDHISPFWQAARHGHISIMRLFLESGRLSNVKPRPAYFHQHFPETPLSIAIKEGYQEMVELLARADGIKPYLTVPHHKDNDGKTSMLGLAIRNGLEEAALALLNKCDFRDAGSSDGDHSDSTTENDIEPISKLLVLAISTGCSRIVRELLTMPTVMGQLLRIPAVDPNAEDHNGLTPLLLAIVSGHGNEYVEILRSRSDINVNQPRPGTDSRPLDIAIQTGNITVMLLRERGAIESVDSTGSYHFNANVTVEVGFLPSAYSEFQATRPHQGQRQYASGSSEGSGTSSASDELHLDHVIPLSGGLEFALRKNLLREHSLPLGEQQAYVREWVKSTAGLCSSCSAIDLGSAFWKRHTEYGGRVITDLGRVDDTWQERAYALCRMFANIYIRTGIKGGYKLVSFSTTQSWLCHAEMARWNAFRFKQFIDTMVFAVIPDTVAADGVYETQLDFGAAARPPKRTRDAVKAAFSFGLIGRLGSNGPSGASVTIPRLGAMVSDWSVARGWITTCREDHQRRCKSYGTANIPHFYLIESTTRKILEHKPSQPNRRPEYVALSYV